MEKEKSPIKQLDDLKKELCTWFKGVYEGGVSVNKLYDKGRIIKKKIGKISFNIYDLAFMNLPIFSDLKESLEFIDELHDSETRKYHSKHLEVIYYHMRRLS